MAADLSKIIYEQFYRCPCVRVQLRNGLTLEGRFIGFYYGDVDRGESFVKKWHFLEKSSPLFDYDNTIDPEAGIIIEQTDIAQVSPVSE